MKLQGKIKSIPVKEVTEEMQVMVRGLIMKAYPSKTHIDFSIIRGFNRKNQEVQRLIHISELKTLVVEHGNGRSDNYKWEKQLPLKHSQWQAAIDNGEVDSDKTVEFEIVQSLAQRADKRDNLPDQIAKIIPTKKSIYSDKDKHHLKWIYNRLINVHDEDPNYDYMLKFKEIIDK